MNNGTTNGGNGEQDARLALSWVPLTENLLEAGMASPSATTVRQWRFDVQKAFLGRGRARLHDTDMAAYDTLFAEIETHEMSVLDLEYSKIGKVMRHIATLPNGALPKENEFKFRPRAMEMAERWRRVLDNARRVKDLEDDLDTVRGLEKGHGLGDGQGHGGVMSMPGSLEGLGSGGTPARYPESTRGSTSVLDWVQSQLLEVQPDKSLRIDYHHDLVKSPANAPAKTEEVPSALTVEEWRDTLQKGFLSKTPASGQEMQALHSLFTKIEAYERAGTLPPGYILSSGIAGVVDRISRLPVGGVSRDEEFGFRDRARGLGGLWRGIIDEDEEKAREMPGGIGDLPQECYDREKSRAVDVPEEVESTRFGQEHSIRSSALPPQSEGRGPGIPGYGATEPCIMTNLDALHIDTDRLSTRSLQDQEVIEDWKLVEPEPETPHEYESKKLQAGCDADGEMDDDDWEFVHP